MSRVHNSPYCGNWFPRDRTELGELLESVFERSRQRTAALPAGPLAFVVPHAAPVYSGTVAAAAYRCLEQHAPARVVLLGFSHRRYHTGVWIPDVDAYATPLGEVGVDMPAARALEDQRLFRRMPEQAMCDHSVEVQLPLLRAAAPRAGLLPLYVGELEPDQRREAAGKLAALAGPDTAFLASSDLTHYGPEFGFVPFPCDGAVGEKLESMDRRVIDGAGSLDPALFARELRETGSTTCGRAPISLLMETLRQCGGDEVFQEQLDYQTSGEITGDWSHSVSYAALGYFPARSFLLEEGDRRALLESACSTLETLTSSGRGTRCPPRGGSAALERQAGVFVTLHQHGELRGCVGSYTARRALAESVPELTLSAATEDPRFDPVRKGETGFQVEISVLTPTKRVASPRSVVAGEHGAVIEHSRRTGLLLPQVASERGWGREAFLRALAAKAGLRAQALEDAATRLWVFRAQVFASDLGSGPTVLDTIQ